MTRAGRICCAVCTIALAILWAGTDGWATETRVGTMGGVGLYTRDNSNVIHFPGKVVKYRDQVLSELRIKNDHMTYTIGAHMALTEDETTVFGAYLNRPSPVEIAVPNWFQPLTINYTTDLLFGMNMGEFDMGMRLSVGMDGYSDKEEATGSPADEENASARYLALAGGISSHMMDLAAGIELPSAKWEYEKDEESFGGLGFNLLGRLFVGDPEATEIVPVGRLRWQSTKLEDSPEDSEDKLPDKEQGKLMLGLGVGWNYRVNESNLVVFAVEALGLDRDNTKQGKDDAVTTTTMTLPGIYMGVESSIRPWLTGRVGAAQVYQRTTTKTERRDYERETTMRTSRFQMTFGLGFRFGSFDLDLSINEGLLFDGPNVLSGTQETLADRLSVTYNF